MSYTPLGFNKQDTGSGTNVWGSILNSECFDLIDEAIRGRAAFTVSGAVTLTSTNGESNQARCAFLDITGGTGGTVTIPSISRFYFVRNGASGNVTISTGAAETARVEPGMLLPVITDGSSVWTLRIASLPLKDYIDSAILATTGSLPAATGNTGKALVVVDPGSGAAWTPTQLTSSHISDFQDEAAAIALVLGRR